MCLALCLLTLAAGPGDEPFPAAPPLAVPAVAPLYPEPPPAHAAAPDPALSADSVVDRWRTALGLDLPARRPVPPVARSTRPAPRVAVPAWSWRQAPDNPAVELYTDGRTWTAWRYRAGFAPPPVTAAPPVVAAPSYRQTYSFSQPYCPPGGS